MLTVRSTIELNASNQLTVYDILLESALTSLPRVLLSSGIVLV
jgi:hypothetical protein